MQQNDMAEAAGMEADDQSWGGVSDLPTFPLTSLKLGSQSANGSILSVHVARDVGQLVFFVDNSPWSSKGMPRSKSAQLLLLHMVLSSQPLRRTTSPFANRTGMAQLSRQFKKLEEEEYRKNSAPLVPAVPPTTSPLSSFLGSAASSSSQRLMSSRFVRRLLGRGTHHHHYHHHHHHNHHHHHHHLHSHRALKWQALIAMVRRLQAKRRALSRMQPPPRGLCGCVTFEVRWSDVAGISYRNLLQEDTLMALEAMEVVKREYSSLTDAKRSHAARICTLRCSRNGNQDVATAAASASHAQPRRAAPLSDPNAARPRHSLGACGSCPGSPPLSAAASAARVDAADLYLRTVHDAMAVDDLLPTSRYMTPRASFRGEHALTMPLPSPPPPSSTSSAPVKTGNGQEAERHCQKGGCGHSHAQVGEVDWAYRVDGGRAQLSLFSGLCESGEGGAAVSPDVSCAVSDADSLDMATISEGSEDNVTTGDEEEVDWGQEKEEEEEEEEGWGDWLEVDQSGDVVHKSSRKVCNVKREGNGHGREEQQHNGPSEGGCERQGQEVELDCHLTPLDVCASRVVTSSQWGLGNVRPTLEPLRTQLLPQQCTLAAEAHGMQEEHLAFSSPLKHKTILHPPCSEACCLRRSSSGGSGGAVSGAKDPAGEASSSCNSTPRQRSTLLRPQACNSPVKRREKQEDDRQYLLNKLLKQCRRVGQTRDLSLPDASPMESELHVDASSRTSPDHFGAHSLSPSIQPSLFLGPPCAPSAAPQNAPKVLHLRPRTGSQLATPRLSCAGPSKCDRGHGKPTRPVQSCVHSSAGACLATSDCGCPDSLTALPCPPPVEGTAASPCAQPSPRESAEVFHSRLIVFRFRDPHLPEELRAAVLSDPRLLRLVESDLPPWSVFWQTCPGISFIYRPWIRHWAMYMYVLVSLVTALIGLYELYKNVPILRATVTHALQPLLRVLGSLDMATRLRYLGTIVFLQNCQRAFRTLAAIARGLGIALSFLLSRLAFFLQLLLVLFHPLVQPIQQLVLVLLGVGNMFTAAFGGVVGTIASGLFYFVDGLALAVAAVGQPLCVVVSLAVEPVATLCTAVWAAVPPIMAALAAFTSPILFGLITILKLPFNALLLLLSGLAAVISSLASSTASFFTSLTSFFQVVVLRKKVIPAAKAAASAAASAASAATASAAAATAAATTGSRLAGSSAAAVASASSAASAAATAASTAASTSSVPSAVVVAGNDLLQKVLKAAQRILNSFVAFCLTCNRHRLSLYYWAEGGRRQLRRRVQRDVMGPTKRVMGRIRRKVAFAWAGKALEGRKRQREEDEQEEDEGWREREGQGEEEDNGEGGGTFEEQFVTPTCSRLLEPEPSRAAVHSGQREEPHHSVSFHPGCSEPSGRSPYRRLTWVPSA